jgi:chemotaxis protein CheY-P-specific phosphatase CheC
LVGDVPGALWWVLPMEAADTLGRRLLRRPSATGTLSASASAALGEAANIVASAFCSTAGSLVRAKMLPSTPLAVETNVEALVAAPEIEAEIIGVSAFLSTNAPHFRGTLVSRFSPESVARLLSALGNQ